MEQKRLKHLLTIVLFTIALLTFTLATTLAQQATHSTELLGGQATVYNTTENAFGLPIPGLSRQQRLLFFVGNSFFNQNWVTAPASTTARDGLGALFNARSCSGCHFKDGRGRALISDDESPTGFLVRLRILQRELNGSYLGDPTYGGQFQNRALEGIVPEGTIRIKYASITGKFADGIAYELRQPTLYLENLGYGELHPEVTISPRVANQMIGLGLLEALTEETLLTLADPNDRDEDGVSGRPNYVWDFYNNRQAIGRFGWKANQPHLLQQTASAFHGDMGITTSLLPHTSCTASQIACSDAIDGGHPEISDDDLLKVVLYTQSLAVPAQRNSSDPQVQKGYSLFIETRCHSCHVETLVTGVHPTVPALSYQTIHPFTDLLLHDMGDGLADGSPDYEASGTEWRTPPLWGIGLFGVVNGHTTYLHDGRARNLTEAILWHGGEAEFAREAFLQMELIDRDALLAFLNSL